MDPEPTPPSPVLEPGSPTNRENAYLRITNTSNTPRTKVREEDKQINRERQIAQGIKVTRRLEASVGASGVEHGAVVAVRNDPRDISHAHGTVGVVYD